MSQWWRPQSAREAQLLFDRLRATASADVAFIGGGTAVQLNWPQAETAGGLGAVMPAVDLIDVGSLIECRGLALVEEGAQRLLRIGAACRLESLRRDPLIREHAPLLHEALQSLAALSVRHLATLGGNLGWRWGDCVPALLAMDAQVALADGERLSLAQWLARPAAPLLIAVQVPLGTTSRRVVFEKVGLRAAFSPTRLALAASWCQDDSARLDDVRIAVSAAGLVGRRLSAAEQWFHGRVATPGSRDDAGWREGLKAACAQQLDDAPALVRLATRLLSGHLGAAA